MKLIPQSSRCFLEKVVNGMSMHLVDFCFSLLEFFVSRGRRKSVGLGSGNLGIVL